MISLRLRIAYALLRVLPGLFASPLARAQSTPQTPQSDAQPADPGAVPPSGQTPAPPPAPAPPTTQTYGPGGATAPIQEEVGSRDLFYLRNRILFRYDYRLQAGQVSTDRFRLNLLYAFGPQQRMAISVTMPVLHTDTPTGSASGSGDMEIQGGVNLFLTEHFHSGVAFQVTCQTSSENLLGGASTTIKPAWGFGWALSPRFEVTGVLYYQQSIHTVRGTPIKQFEPDFTFNTRFRGATWFVEWDSFYDFIPQMFAQTMKTGVSKRFGKRRQWVADAYYSVALNPYATKTQYKYNPGIDLTWYPFPNR